MPLNIPGQPPPVDGAPDGHSQHPARGSEGGAAAGDGMINPAKQGPGPLLQGTRRQRTVNPRSGEI